MIDFNLKYYIRCTADEYSIVLRVLEKLGFRWVNGERIVNFEKKVGIAVPTIVYIPSDGVNNRYDTISLCARGNEKPNGKIILGIEFFNSILTGAVISPIDAIIHLRDAAEHLRNNVIENNILPNFGIIGKGMAVNNREGGIRLELNNKYDTKENLKLSDARKLFKSRNPSLKKLSLRFYDEKLLAPITKESLKKILLEGETLSIPIVENTTSINVLKIYIKLINISYIMYGGELKRVREVFSPCFNPMDNSISIINIINRKDIPAFLTKEDALEALSLLDKDELDSLKANP